MTNSQKSDPTANAVMEVAPKTVADAARRKELKQSQMELRFTLNALAETRRKVEQLRAKIASLQNGQKADENTSNSRS